jgi:type IV secretory pathway TrbF-like protein
MLFRRPSVRYGRTPEPETPYQKAAQAWDERIGAARIQARNWRLIAFGNLFLAAGLAGGLIWQAARGTVTPWVVEVDKLGQAQAVSPAIADYRPTDPQIAWGVRGHGRAARRLSFWQRASVPRRCPELGRPSPPSRKALSSERS